MLRIAFLIPTLNQIGGAERQVILLAKELSKRGHQITVIVLSGDGGDTTQELQSAGISFLSLQMRKAWIDPRGWLRYRAWLTRDRPEIIHTHLPHAAWLARHARLIAPVPVVIDTIHTTHTGSFARRLLYRLSDRLSNQTTCVSHAVAQTVIHAGIARGSKLTILPNGIELTNQPTSIQPDPQPFRWLAIGRLVPLKDYSTLFRAFATLPNQPCIKIAGSGPEEPSLRILATELNIADRVEFLGFRSDTQTLLAEADAFVQSSLWEGLPMSTLEAAAASLPVVATNASGTAETMQPGITGLLAPVRDATELSSSMAQIMSMSSAQRHQMGASGRAFVVAHFSLSIIVTRWEQLYTDLLARHPHASRHCFH